MTKFTYHMSSTSPLYPLLAHGRREDAGTVAMGWAERTGAQWYQLHVNGDRVHTTQFDGILSDMVAELLSVVPMELTDPDEVFLHALKGIVPIGTPVVSFDVETVIDDQLVTWNAGYSSTSSPSEGHRAVLICLDRTATPSTKPPRHAPGESCVVDGVYDMWCCP